MGGGACLIIINEGEIALAVTSVLADRFKNVNFTLLDAGIHASCEVIHHSSLYFELEGEDKLTDEYTKPIIDLHKEVTTHLPRVAKEAMQAKVNILTDDFFAATRKIYNLFPSTGFVPESLFAVRDRLGIAQDT